MKPVLKYALLSLVTLVVAVVATLAFIVGTETGTRLAWKVMRDFLPEDLAVESIEGRLLGPLALQGFELRTDSFHLHVDDFRLRLSPVQLITRRTLAIDLIAARGVRYRHLGAAPKRQEAPGKLNLPERVDLPLDIRV